MGVVLGSLAAMPLWAWQPATFHPLVFLVIFLITLTESQTMVNLQAFRARGATGLAWFFPLRNLLRLAVVYGLCTWPRPFAEVLLGLLVISGAGLLGSNFWVNRLLGADRSPVPLTGPALLATLRSSGPFALISIIGMGYVNMAPILLGLWRGPREVGLYGVAFQIYQV